MRSGPRRRLLYTRTLSRWSTPKGGGAAKPCSRAGAGHVSTVSVSTVSRLSLCPRASSTLTGSASRSPSVVAVTLKKGPKELSSRRRPRACSGHAHVSDFATTHSPSSQRTPRRALGASNEPHRAPPPRREPPPSSEEEAQKRRSGAPRLLRDHSQPGASPCALPRVAARASGRRAAREGAWVAWRSGSAESTKAVRRRMRAAAWRANVCVLQCDAQSSDTVETKATCATWIVTFRTLERPPQTQFLAPPPALSPAVPGYTPTC